jgi:hypothetical protein
LEIIKGAGEIPSGKRLTVSGIGVQR